MLLLAAPLLFYLLGSLLDQAFGIAPVTDDVIANVFRRLMWGLVVGGWVGVALAETGRFSALTATLLRLTACLALTAWLAWRGRRLIALQAVWGRVGRVERSHALAAAGLIVLGTALFAHPGEDVLGARDPGIYYTTGVAIARTGGILQTDPALQSLAGHLGDGSVNYWLFQSVHGWSLRFPGQLFVRDFATGAVEPGFLPWYPVAIAWAVDAAGLDAGLWINPALSVLALIAVFLTGRTLFGAAVGLLGAGLLALDLAQIWFARYTMAEPATQLLVWTGLYTLVTLRVRSTLAFGALSGLAWASTMLVRVDAVLLIPPVSAWLAWRARAPRERPATLLALGIVALGALHFSVYAWRLSPGYTSMVFSGATLAVAAGGVAVTLVTAALAWLLLPSFMIDQRKGGRKGLALLIILLGLAALLAYTIRPLLPVGATGDEQVALETAAKESSVRLGWYVTPLALALALGGVARLLWTGEWSQTAPLLGLVGLSLAFYLPNPLVSSDQPWAARRYLPVVLPGVLLLASYGGLSAGRWLARTSGAPRWLAGALSGVVCTGVALGEWQVTAPIASYREHAGALAQIGALAALIPPEAVVLFPRSPAGMRLSLPLHYLGARAAFVLPAEGPEKDIMAVVRRWRAEERPVYWVVPLGTRFPTPAGVRFVPAGQFTFDTAQLERPLDRLPTGAEPLHFDLQLYRVEVPPASTP